MLQKNVKLLQLCWGPLAFAFFTWILEGSFGFKGAAAIGTTIWMGLWWIMRPVDIAVTSLLPIGINAVFNLIPASTVISQYFSEIVVLLIGSDIISLTWTKTGLDKRLAIKALCFIGPSMRQQITVWLVAATVLSAILPNVVVAMILCPIAVSMLNFIGVKNIRSSKIALPIFLAVAWGSGIGGFGSPLGGAANLTAIHYLENMMGREFMYLEWMVRFIPLLAIVCLLNLAFLLMLPMSVKELGDTRDYFEMLYNELGPMKRGEIIGLVLFSAATLLAFARPWFADIFPGMRPAYLFFVGGLLTFVLRDERSQPMLEWKQAEKGLMWGMFFLFAGGLALGKLVTETGAAAKLAEFIAMLPLSGGLGTVGIFTVFATVLSEISSNTAAASISIPVVESIAKALGLDPIPYVLMTIVAVNCAYVLPVSTRAIPVGYGLEPAELFHKGAVLSLLNIVLTTVIGWIVITYIPWFGAL